MSDFINRYLSFLSKMTEILSTLAALCCDTVILLNVILFGNLDCGNLNIFKMLNPELIFLAPTGALEEGMLCVRASLFAKEQ